MKVEAAVYDPAMIAAGCITDGLTVFLNQGAVALDCATYSDFGIECVHNALFEIAIYPSKEKDPDLHNISHMTYDVYETLYRNTGAPWNTQREVYSTFAEMLARVAQCTEQHSQHMG